MSVMTRDYWVVDVKDQRGILLNRTLTVEDPGPCHTEVVHMTPPSSEPPVTPEDVAYRLQRDHPNPTLYQLLTALRKEGFLREHPEEYDDGRLD